eukprot:1126125-Amorphochlora_amoeboformis.AAC.1
MTNRTLLASVLLLQSLCGALKLQGTLRDFTKQFFQASTAKSTTVSKDQDRSFQITPAGSGKGEWFYTDPEDTFNTVPHSIELTGSSGVMQYDASSGFYPVDGLLYGNQADSNNKYFTFEVDTIVETTSDVSLTFGASCSMWVGTCTIPVSSCTTRLTWNAAFNQNSRYRQKSFTLTSGTRRLWVAYAHNCQAEPKIKIQVPTINLYKRTCDITTAGVFHKNLYPFTGTNLNRGNIFSFSSKSFSLLTTSQSDTFTSAWHPNQLDVKYGFIAEFVYESKSVSPNRGSSYSGFAFVVQNVGSQAAGESGERHFDTIKNAVAVEVSYFSSTQIDVKIEYRFALQKRFTTAATARCTEGSDKSSTIIYDGKTGVLKANIASCTISATLNHDSVFDMWNPHAFIGFTGGVSGLDTLEIDISKWTFRTLQASGAYSTIATAGPFWAQFGQHNGFGGASKSKFNRITDVISSSYVTGTAFNIPKSTSFTSYDPFTTAATNQLEIMYFVNETPMFTSIACDGSDLTLSAFTASYSSSPTGSSKQLTPTSTKPV